MIYCFHGSFSAALIPIEKERQDSIAELEKKEIEEKRKRDEEHARKLREAREKALAEKKKREEEELKASRRSQGLCQHCGGELKGLFSKKCVSCGMNKDY